MKRIVWTFVAVLTSSVALTSCSESDNGRDENSIIGKWNVYQYGAIVDGQEVYQFYPHEEGCEKDFVEFTNNGVFRSTVYSEGCLEQITTLNYVVEGNALIWSAGSQTQTDIFSISGNTLKIRQTLSTNDVVGVKKLDDVEPTNQNQVEIYTFKRVY
ncbi:MAG: lipocalin family protein [Bacteroidota bacterium]|nr:lipocalin family protein [Bacteroidota bacterium]